MKKYLLALLGVAMLGVVALCAGCHASTGTLSRDPVSFLKVIGPTDGVMVTIDELAPVGLPKDRKFATLQVKPGKHHVRCERGNIVLVDRTILVSDDQTLEISLP